MTLEPLEQLCVGAYVSLMCVVTRCDTRLVVSADAREADKAVIHALFGYRHSR